MVNSALSDLKAASHSTIYQNVLPTSASLFFFLDTIPKLIVLLVDFANWKSKLCILPSSFQAFDEKKLNYAELGKGNQLFLRGSPRMCNRIIATAPPNVSQNPRTMPNHQTT